MTEAKPLAWGIIGPGTIAKTFAAALPHSETGRLVAIATRNPGKPGLAEAFPGARILDGYPGACSTIPRSRRSTSPRRIPAHAEWAIRRPRRASTCSARSRSRSPRYEAEAMFNAARKAGTFLGEAFMYRHHPQTRELVELVRVRDRRRGAPDQGRLRLPDGQSRPAAIGCSPTIRPAAAFSTSAATRSRSPG